MTEGWFYETDTVNDMLSRGYAVALTDYEGYHTSPETSYILAQATGPALIDGVRAAQAVPEVGLSPDAPVIFRGYSQGGAAAMSAGELLPEYAPEVNLVGVAGGGVPADLIAMGLPLDGSDAFGMMFYSFLGMSNANPEYDLRSYMNEEGLAALDRMESESCVMDLLLEHKGRSMEDFQADPNQSPITDPVVIELATENKLGEQPVDVPVYQYHAVGDEVVAFPQAESLSQDYCAQGVDLTWETFGTSGGGANGITQHLQLVEGGNPSVNQFIEARLAGEPPTSTCRPLPSRPSRAPVAPPGVRAGRCQQAWCAGESAWNQADICGQPTGR